MSWDVVIFNLNRKVNSVEEIGDSILVDIGTYTAFKEVLQEEFPNIAVEEDWITIQGNDYTLETSLGDLDETFTNTMFQLSGENAVYALINLCKKKGWQAFDTHLGEMLDLENPERSGYQNYTAYVAQILQKR
jgi:hypothetical protein